MYSELGKDPGEVSGWRVQLSSSALSLPDGHHLRLILVGFDRLITTVVVLRGGHSSSSPAIGGCSDFISSKSNHRRADT